MSAQKIEIEILTDKMPYHWRVSGPAFKSAFLQSTDGVICGTISESIQSYHHEQILAAWRDATFAIAMYFHQKALEDAPT